MRRKTGSGSSRGGTWSGQNGRPLSRASREDQKEKQSQLLKHKTVGPDVHKRAVTTIRPIRWMQRPEETVTNGRKEDMTQLNPKPTGR